MMGMSKGSELGEFSGQWHQVRESCVDIFFLGKTCPIDQNSLLEKVIFQLSLFFSFYFSMNYFFSFYTSNF